MLEISETSLPTAIQSLSIDSTLVLCMYNCLSCRGNDKNLLCFIVIEMMSYYCMLHMYQNHQSDMNDTRAIQINALALVDPCMRLSTRRVARIVDHPLFSSSPRNYQALRHPASLQGITRRYVTLPHYTTGCWPADLCGETHSSAIDLRSPMDTVFACSSFQPWTLPQES